MSEMGAGRYLISVEAVETRDPGQVVVHDLDRGVDERCNTDAIKRRSRFNDLAWAKSKGYRLCEYCFPDQMEPA